MNNLNLAHSWDEMGPKLHKKETTKLALKFKYEGGFSINLELNSGSTCLDLLEFA